ncbi:MAG: exonuclease SbcCD subunit D [Bacteroidales bacterium]|jgi:exonuclease SbcD|nr:exonuclease SbcCD subunit D [Bacteroidales bacterium]
MKIIHLSDLHIGKRVNGFNMIEDQDYILQKILTAIQAEKPDVLLIAGDVYDKDLPPREAVSLLDDFLTNVADCEVKIMLIGGNHDSAERLSFGSRLMEARGVYIEGGYRGKTAPILLEDTFGKVCFYLFPFIKPVNIKRFFPDDEINSYTDAVDVAIKNMEVDTSIRNVIVAHQFVTGGERSESEDISIGGTDNVNANVFDCFDYVALGHLHRPQSVEKAHIRYCGTPLKYSFSEANDKKSLTVIELKEKGNMNIREIPLVPLHDMREIKGKYKDLMYKKNYENTQVEDYLHIILTDEEEEYNAFAKLKIIYPNIMQLDYDNRKTQRSNVVAMTKTISISPQELFHEFFTKQTGREMSDEQKQFVADLVEEIWEDKQ